MSKKTFAEILSDLRYGTLHDDLTESMQELVSACVDTGKVGRLTLTINVKPGKSGELVITDDIKKKVPELDKGSSIMWATPEGNLTRQDPRQMTIEGVKVIGQDERPLKGAK